MSDSSIHNDGIYDVDTTFREEPSIKKEDRVFIILVLMLMLV